MKHYNTKVVEKQVLAATECDLCGATKGVAGWPVKVGQHEVATIIHRSVTELPEGSFGEELEVDLCPACFKETVLPALRKLGIKRQPKEI